jgi:xylan 1,4-beta-xylosidase
MGSPDALNDSQLKRLHALTADKPEIQRVQRTDRQGRLTMALPMRSNDVVLVTFEPLNP